MAFGALLLATVVGAGLWLTAASAPGLVWIGAAGLFIRWTYSALPLKLNAAAWAKPAYGQDSH